MMGIEDGTFDWVVLGDEPPFGIKIGETHIKELFEMFPHQKKELQEYLDFSEGALQSFPFFVVSNLWSAFCSHVA